MRSLSRPSPRRRTSRSSPSSLWAYRGSFQASARIRADIQGETGLRIKEARTKRMTTAKELEELGLVVKGFRMPASHCAKGCVEAGVRKASKEETAGEVCAWQCRSMGI